MSLYRTVVVDDEPLAREKLRKLIEQHDTLEYVAEAENGVEAVEVIDSMSPDLVFLDIRMPGLSGLEVLERIVHQPHVIFTTAFEEFAVTAFELQALDYLLKPFGKRRFDLALSRLTSPPLSSPDRVRAAMGSEPIRQLFVRERGRIRSIMANDIVRIEAADDYAEIFTGQSSHLMATRMKSLADRLDPTRFVRIHRSTIVNLTSIDEVESCGNGRYEVRMLDGTVLVASRSGAALLRAAID